MTFHLDSDSIEVEGMPCDELIERAMKQGSRALLCALNRARGLPPPFLPKPSQRPTVAFAPLPRELVERYVRPEPPLKAPKPRLHLVVQGMSAKEVIRAVAEAFELTPADLTSPRRSLPHVLARQVVIRLLRDRTWANGLPRFSTPQIGRMINRDHTSVLHALQTFDAKSRAYPEMRAVYDAIKAAAL